LGKLELKLAEDDPTKYVLFQTRKSGYSGALSFTLPKGILSSAITNVTLQINFNYTASTKQTWTWSLYDWGNKKWVKVGETTILSRKTRWKILAFPVQNLARYLSPAQEILVQLHSNNARGDAKIDYEVIQVTYSSDPTLLQKILPTVTLVPVSPSPTYQMVVPTATELPTITASPVPTEVLPVATETSTETPSPTPTIAP
jgi:hypothetical protein